MRVEGGEIGFSGNEEKHDSQQTPIVPVSEHHLDTETHLNVRNDSSPLSAAVEWVSRLVEIETVSRNSNLGLIETVRDFLGGVGLKTHLTYEARKTKANLFATIPAADGRVNGGIVFSGHTDVAPVDGQDWRTDPFHALTIDDRLYGRGSADMKGYLGALLSLASELADARLADPVHLALSLMRKSVVSASRFSWLTCVSAEFTLQAVSWVSRRPCVRLSPTRALTTIDAAWWAAPYIRR